ncbi:MAG: DUF4316 domain-containing protein [Clostridiales bacterium]|jgi:hypothetical protein|nr:DUF4316 domain-containing protein [Clostridiales bacterium]
MAHNYTRQRQGKDFSIFNCLRNAEMSVEGNYNQIYGIINNTPKDDNDTKKQSMLERLEQFNQEAERNASPVDGHEPVPERGMC